MSAFFARRRAHREVELSPGVLPMSASFTATRREQQSPGVLPMSLFALLFFCACGTAPGRFEVVDQTGPSFRLEGACSPSTVSRASTVDVRTTSCLRGTPAPLLVDSQAELDALLDPNCPTDFTIDFTVNRVLVVSARGASEWFVFPNFVGERNDAMEVGLVIRPQGAPPPDSLLLLPRNALPVELRWCRSVCVARCDQPIP